MVNPKKITNWVLKHVANFLQNALGGMIFCGIALCHGKIGKVRYLSSIE
jgi:hypothetical protein